MEKKNKILFIILLGLIAVPLFSQSVESVRTFANFTVTTNYTITANDQNLANLSVTAILINHTNLSNSKLMRADGYDIAVWSSNNRLRINTSFIKNMTGEIGWIYVELDSTITNGSSYPITMVYGNATMNDPPVQFAPNLANIPTKVNWLTEIGTATGKGDNLLEKCNSDSYENIINNASKSCDFVNVTSVGLQHGSGNNLTFEADFSGYFFVNQISITVISTQGADLQSSFFISQNNLSTVQRVHYIEGDPAQCDDDCTIEFHPVWGDSFRWNGKGDDFANNIPNTREIAVFRPAWGNATSTYASLNTTASNTAPSNPIPLINSTLGTNFTNENINIYFTPSDPEADPLTCNVDWYRNNILLLGQTISCTSGSAFRAFLSHENTTRGDIIYGKANVSDSSLISSMVTTSNITILNSVPNTPSLHKPNNQTVASLNILTIEFNWSNVSDLDGDQITYYLEVWNDSSATAFMSRNESVKETANVTSALVTFPNQTGDYFWRVLANDGVVNTSFSEFRNISINVNRPPRTVDLHLPFNNTNFTFQSVNINWSNTTDPDGDEVSYLLQVSDTKDFTSFLAVNYSITERTNVTTVNTSLSAGKRFFRIITYDGKQNSSASEVRTINIDNIAPNLTLLNPINFSTNNSNVIPFGYNVSEDITSLQTCSFYHNQTGTWHINQSQTPVQGVNNFSLNFGSNSYTTFLWNVQCNDTMGNIRLAVNNLTLTVDRINPIITFTTPSSANTTTVNGNFNLNIALSDESLFAFEFNITNASGFGVAYNKSELLNASGITTSYTIQDFINISNMSNGRFNITVRASDAHTQKEIGDYNKTIDKPNKKIEYITTEDNTVSIIMLSTNKVLNNLTTNKVKDKYNFGYELQNDGSQTNVTFKVSSEYPLYYIQNAGYRGHFVSLGKLSEGGNWIDFEFNDSSAVYDIKKIDTNNYSINIITSESALNFSSIGGLNIVTTDATFAFNTSEVPIVTLVSPPQNYKDTDGNITFEYNASVAVSTISSCTLYTDGVPDQTDSTITLNINQSFSKVYGADDAHTWQVRCSTSAGTIGLSTVRDFSIGIVNSGGASEGGRGGGATTITCPPGTSLQNGDCISTASPIVQAVTAVTQETASILGDSVDKLIDTAKETGERVTDAIKNKSLKDLKAVDFLVVGILSLTLYKSISIVRKKKERKR